MKKSIASFLKLTVLVFLFGLYTSCQNNDANDISSQKNLDDKPRYTVRIFNNTDSSFGFDILLNNNLYIHQPIIPFKEGFNGFATRKDAEILAQLMLDRLQADNYKFLITPADIDTKLLGSNTGKKITLDNHNGGFDSFINAIFFNTNADSFFNKLPSLPDAPVKGLWRPKGLVPFGHRGGASTFSIGNMVYIGGGENKDMLVNDFWQFNTTTGAWTCLAALQGELRYGGVSFATDSIGYVGLGEGRSKRQDGFRTDFFAYYPKQNKWVRKADFIGLPRVDASAFTLNNKGYVGTGYDGGFASDFYEYDPAKDNWKRIADFGGGPVSSAYGISTGTHGYVVAGDKGSNNQKFLYEYLPQNNTWVQRPDMPGKPRYFLTGFGIDTGVFIAGNGGSEGGEMRLRDYYIFNVAQNKWTQTDDYPADKLGNARPAGAVVKGNVFAGTGFNNYYLQQWNEYQYYFPIRTSPGLYNETTCYPLKYDGNWQLYQECTTEDCYAGAAIKTKENLGKICYVSSLSYNSDLTKETGKIILPRSFSFGFEHKPAQPVGLRLFFTKQEIDDAIKTFNKTSGYHATVSGDVKLLISNLPEDPQTFNGQLSLNNSSAISPSFYTYGWQGQTIVAEFNTTYQYLQCALVIGYK